MWQSSPWDRENSFDRYVFDCQLFCANITWTSPKRNLKLFSKIRLNFCGNYPFTSHFCVSPSGGNISPAWRCLLERFDRDLQGIMTKTTLKYFQRRAKNVNTCRGGRGISHRNCMNITWIFLLGKQANPLPNRGEVCTYQRPTNWTIGKLKDSKKS